MSRLLSLLLVFVFLLLRTGCLMLPLVEENNRMLLGREDEVEEIGIILLCEFSQSQNYINQSDIYMIEFQVIRKKLKELHKDMQEKQGKVRSFMQEVLENILVVKVLQRL